MTDLKQTLRDLRSELGTAERLSEEDRALLETVLADIHRVLEAPVSPATPVEHGDALEGAAVRLEAGHPGLAIAVRAVLDALGKAGI
jgi:hypothetical protein